MTSSPPQTDGASSPDSPDPWVRVVHRTGRFTRRGHVPALPTSSY
jgi:hypothetical protein